MAYGPDFSQVTSLAKAEALARDGRLQKLLLLPLEFGGQDIPQNVVYVPLGMADIKHGIDNNVVRPLVADGTVTRYAATPAYDGDSFIPVSITIVASEPGSFTTTINLWGSALRRDADR
jgi:hypothetical protein